MKDTASPAIAAVQWQGCYESSWKGLIVPKAFGHPAKFAKGLVERIIDHGLACGYWKAGELLGDPFGGVALGGIAAAYRRLQWIGLELEGKFVQLGNDNISLHRRRLEQLSFPVPVLLQGDSRKFDLFVDAAVTSPPYAESLRGTAYNGIDPEKLKKHSPGARSQALSSEGYGDTEGQIGALREGSVDAAITSPPYAEMGGNPGTDLHPERINGRFDHKGTLRDGYGGSEGQIGALKAGELDGLIGSPPFSPDQPSNSQRATIKDGTERETHMQSDGNIDALPTGSLAGAITSPPYAGIASGAGGLNTKPAKPGQQGGRNPSAASQTTDQQYGESDGQISKLPDGAVEGVITSPPWEDNCEGKVGAHKFNDPTAFAAEMSARSRKGHEATQEAREAQLERDAEKTYGDSEGQIGKLKGGSVDGAVTSPPYEEGLGHGGGNTYLANDTQGTAKAMLSGYGKSEGQIGNNRQSGETYWQAMALVYRACWRSLKPGGVMAVVVKDYVKAKKIVPLCDDTLRLLEAIGFLPIERVRAMVRKETPHPGLDGADVVTVREKKSFFRRLAEKKGSPRIDWEEVLFVRKVTF